MKTLIDLTRLTEICQGVYQQYDGVDQIVSDLFYLMYMSGLRVMEVVETWRWQLDAGGNYQVTLEKGDAIRGITSIYVKSSIKPYYDNQTEFPYLTYSSLNWRAKKAAPIVTTNSDTRRTTTHLFRYRLMKYLHSAGLTDQQIQNYMKHASLGSTQRYIYDDLFEWV